MKYLRFAIGAALSLLMTLAGVAVLIVVAILIVYPSLLGIGGSSCNDLSEPFDREECKAAERAADAEEARFSR